MNTVNIFRILILKSKVWHKVFFFCMRRENEKILKGFVIIIFLYLKAITLKSLNQKQIFSLNLVVFLRIIFILVEYRLLSVL